MRCPVCKRLTLWIRKESGRKILVDFRDQNECIVDKNNMFDPSIHQDHALTCYVPYSRSHKYSIQVEPASV